jgi:undecaprenyl-diphosphatase
MDLLESVHNAEIDLFRAMNLAGTNGPLDSVMVLFTILGISYVIVLVCIPLWLQGKRDAAFDVAVLVVLATLAAEALKLIVDRPRPSLELDRVRTLVSATGPAFPSAHATRAFAVACLICYVEPRKYGLGALFLASLISLSRVYLGVHWPTDVLAGAVLGVAVAVGLERFARESVGYQSLRKRIVGILSGKPP